MAGEPDTFPVLVNGERVELPAACSVAELAGRVAAGQRYAVEINGEIIPRSQHAERLVRAGDRIEIVRAIGGG